MTGTLGETKRNLRTVGQFDLASALESDSIAAEEPRILEYTRYLIALNRCRSHYAGKIRAGIIAALWGCADKFSEGEHLRVITLVCVEQLVRECSDIESIQDKLEILSAAYAASFHQSHDLRKLSPLVGLKEFGELRSILPPPSTNAIINVFGRAYKYHKCGNMNGLACSEAFKEAESRSLAGGVAQWVHPLRTPPEMNTPD